MSDYQIHIELKPKIHLIRASNQSRFPYSNSLLIDDEILTLIDAGTDYANIAKTFHDLGHDVSDLDRIILTHFHIDHKGHSAALQKESECEILCHPSGEAGIIDFEGLLDFWGIREHYYYDAWMSCLDSHMPHVRNPCEVNGYLHHDRPIPCGETVIIPIHSPGHTQDHTCIGINGFETILLVDIDLTSFGPWYGNRVSDINHFMESLERICAMAPIIGVSSHLIEPVIDNLQWRLESFLKAFEIRNNRILKRISEGSNTIGRLLSTPIFYSTIPSHEYLFFEEVMLKKHLEFLSKREDIHTEDGIIVVEKDWEFRL